MVSDEGRSFMRLGRMTHVAATCAEKNASQTSGLINLPSGSLTILPSSMAIRHRVIDASSQAVRNSRHLQFRTQTTVFTHGS